jgi:hypothetical protein
VSQTERSAFGRHAERLAAPAPLEPPNAGAPAVRSPATGRLGGRGRGVVLGCVLFACLSSTAMAVTMADVTGKKICWGSNYMTFTGGKVYSNVVGDGTWSLNKAGVIALKFPSGPYSGIVKALKRGGLEYSGSWVGTPKLTAVGGYCN